MLTNATTAIMSNLRNVFMWIIPFVARLKSAGGPHFSLNFCHVSRMQYSQRFLQAESGNEMVH